MDVHEEIHRALDGQGGQYIAFEEIEDEGDSPLNQPVVKPKKANEKLEAEAAPPDPDGQQTSQEYDDTPDDAPQQEIDENYDEGATVREEAEFEIPNSHLGEGADAILGMTNNMLEFGGGFFVTIRKDKEFYEFDEVIHVIEKQNKKNIKRFKLDKEDKALLRPLMIAVAKKRAGKLSPEHLLVGAILTIIVKKAKAAFEIRAENEILEDRIREIIREERDYTDQDQDDDYDEDDDQGQEQDRQEAQHPQQEPLETEVAQPQTISPEQILEVAEDTPEKNLKKRKSNEYTG